MLITPRAAFLPQEISSVEASRWKMIPTPSSLSNCACVPRINVWTALNVVFLCERRIMRVMSTLGDVLELVEVFFREAVCDWMTHMVNGQLPNNQKYVKISSHVNLMPPFTFKPRTCKKWVQNEALNYFTFHFHFLSQWNFFFFDLDVLSSEWASEREKIGERKWNTVTHLKFVRIALSLPEFKSMLLVA